MKADRCKDRSPQKCTLGKCPFHFTLGDGLTMTVGHDGLDL